MRDRLVRSLPLAVLVLLLIWRAFDLAPGTALRMAGFDLMHEALPRSAGASRTPVIIVSIDDESRRRLGAWPWPRTVLAGLADRLREAGASAVSFDMVFDAADRLSPARILPFWPQTPEVDALRAQIRDLPDHDVIFVDSLAAARAVIAFQPVARLTERLPDLKGRFEGDLDAARDFTEAWPGALANITLIEAAAAGNGALAWGDPPGIPVRRVPLAIRVQGQYYPSFAAELVRVHLEARNYAITLADQSARAFFRRAGINSVTIGQLQVPTDANGQLVLYYGRESNRRVVPAWEVLDSAFSGEGFENAIVIVAFGGELASGQELRRTPFGAQITRARANAQAVEQMLAGAFLIRPDYAPAAELAALLVLGLILIYIAARLRRWLSVVAAGLLIVLLPVAAAWHLFAEQQLRFDTLYLPVSLGFLFAVALSQRMTLRFWRRVQIRISFGRSLAPALVERLASGDQPIITDGETRTLTLLYADIRGFATLVGRRGPREAIRLINQYLTPMSQAILNHRGMIDKFMGDAVMAFWNAPLEDPEHARNACRAALRIGKGLERLNAERRKKAGRQQGQFIPVEAGIGLVTDRFYVGEIGSEDLRRREYSVLGTGTNVATYLESQAKYYGVPILTDEATWQKVPDFAFLELDLILPPDSTEPMRIYAVLGDETRAVSDAFEELSERHQEMLRTYRNRQWSAALDATKKCLEAGGAELSDLYELYAARIRAFQRRPPPENWNGVYRPSDGVG